MSNNESTKGEIVMYQPDETIRLEVRVESETVWLTQAQLVSLFQSSKANISEHIKNIYEQGELKKSATVRKFRTVQNEGGRMVLPPIEGIFYDGQIFDAYAHIISLIKQAKTSIVLIDNYIDVDTLTMLSNRNANVSATIYTRQLSQQQQLDVQRHNQQYTPIIINICQRNHDRFLIIDDVVYVFGASLKDAGKKLFAYIRMQETSPSDLLSNIR
jgi:hypothetical protein